MKTITMSLTDVLLWEVIDENYIYFDTYFLNAFHH